MTLTEKQNIAAMARKLMFLLEECDDYEFVDMVVQCINDRDVSPLYVEGL